MARRLKELWWWITVIFLIALLTLLGGCVHTPTQISGITVAYEEEGVVKFRTLEEHYRKYNIRPTPMSSPGFNNTGIFAEGPLPAPGAN